MSRITILAAEARASGAVTHRSPAELPAGATVTCPTLVVYGSKTYPSLKHASRSLADVLPNATLRELPGQKHAVKPSAIVPVIAEFVAGQRPSRPAHSALQQ